MTLLKRLIKANQYQFQNILSHSFNQELIKGILPASVYKYFVEQDKVYLQKFSHVLEKISKKMTKKSHQELFTKLHQQCVAYETSMLTLTSISIFKPQKSPAVLNYTKHLAQCLQANTLVSIAAIIPCFWTYCEIGKHIEATIPKDHKFYLWLSTYNDPTYQEATQELMNAFEELTEGLTDPKLIHQIEAAFSHSFLCEYELFSTCYQKETQLIALPK